MSIKNLNNISLMEHSKTYKKDDAANGSGGWGRPSCEKKK